MCCNNRCNCCQCQPQQQVLDCSTAQINISQVVNLTEDLSCVGAYKGEDLSTVLHKINSKLCISGDPTTLRVTPESAGSNCTYGGSKIEVVNTVTNLPVSTSFVCNPKPEGMSYIKVSLTADQLKNANTAPIIIIPAPGDNKFIQIIATTVKLNFNTTAFTASILKLATAPSAYYPQVQAPLDFTLSAFHGITVPSLTSSNTMTVNAPIYAVAPSNSLVGDGTMDLYITYRIVDL